MNTTLILLCACLTLIGQSAFAMDWTEFKIKHNKNYQNQLEETMRRSLFEANKQRVELFNREKAVKAGFELGINHLTDRTDEEFAALCGFRLPKKLQQKQLKNSPESQKYLDDLLASVKEEDLPNTVDWTKVDGRVSAVKDQGNCGSCWAFSATGALEGQMKVRNSTLIPLSEQNLVDCSQHNIGCAGGYMDDAWKDIAGGGGIMSEVDYPYTAKVARCKFVLSKVVFDDKSSAYLKEGDEAALKKLIATFGPVSVAIDAKGEGFRPYKRGVYYGEDCLNDTEKLNHGVLVVGYGTDEATNKDYWLVKNSWATDWGLDGYIKMSRNADNNCGIATNAMIPTF